MSPAPTPVRSPLTDNMPFPALSGQRPRPTRHGMSASCKPNARGEPGPGLSPQRPVVFGIRRKPQEDAAEGRKHLLRKLTYSPARTIAAKISTAQATSSTEADEACPEPVRPRATP